MKRICLLLSALCLLCAPPAAAAAETEAKTAEQLNVYNWGVYMDLGTDDGSYYDEATAMDVNRAFEDYYRQTYGREITVNYTTYENNEALYQKLSAGGANYDVIVPSDYMANRMIQEDMLEKLDFANIPHYADVDEAFKGDDWHYDPTHEYTVPYMWGYVGIVYNTGKVSGAVNQWDVLWNEAYKGKILMFNNARDAFAIALAKNGFSLNSPNAAEWQVASDDLKAQKPLVQGYVTDEAFDKMQNGEAWLAPCYYGDYLIMKANAAEGVELAFGTITRQTANKFVDLLCIPKGCQNKLAAERYIDFLCQYQTGLANAHYTGYSSPLTTVRNNTGGLYYHYAGDPGVYPSESVLAGYEDFLYLGTSSQARMDGYWKELKKSTGDVVMYASFAGLLALAAALLAVRFARSRRRERLRKAAREQFDKKAKNKA